MTSRPRGTVKYCNAGRSVLVSGGAQGIGRAICLRFADSGADVTCLDTEAWKVEPEDSLESAKRVRGIVGDVSRESDCKRAVNEHVNRCGGLDVLVNNAAIQPPESYVAVHELSSQAWDKMLAVNFTGYTLLAKHALRVMLEQSSGIVVNMASGQGHRTARQVPCYGPIKAGNLLQSRQWGIEYARHGIRVVSVSPGAIDTPLVRASLAEQGGEAKLANRHPLGRIGTPDEVAKAVLWLASGDASFVTATDLQVDGGLGAFGAFAEPYDLPSKNDS